MDYNFLPMKIAGSFLLVLWIFSATQAHASDLTLFGGLQREGRITLRSAVQSGTNLTFDPKNFGTFGVRFSHGRVIGMEHTLAYSPNFIERRTRAVIYNSDLMIQAPFPGVRPYVTAGIGAIFSSGNVVDIGSKFAANYGGGLKFFPANHVGGRIDVRGYAVPRIQSQTLNILEVSLGVVFSF